MTTKQLYLWVYERHPMETGEFFPCLSACVRRLLARYPTGLLAAPGDGSITAPRTLEEETGIDPLYAEALVNGVLYEASGQAAHDTRFREEADRAYLTLWRRAARGKRARAVRG